MDWVLAATMVIGVWAFLSTLGVERARRIRDLDYEIARAHAEAARAAEAAAQAPPK